MKCQHSIRKCRERLSCRVVTAMMMFMIVAVKTMMLANLNVTVGRMVISVYAEAHVPECVASNNTEQSHPENYKNSLGPRYNWSRIEQAGIYSAYYYGQIISAVPGAVVAENLGSRYVIGITTFLAGLLTISIPIMASIDFSAVNIVRVLIGYMGGPVFPALHTLVANWATPADRGKFLWSLLGGNAGTALTWLLLVFGMYALPWPCAYYVTGCIAVFASILWMVVIVDKPEDSKTITEKELNYIKAGVGHNVYFKKKNLNLKRAFRSKELLALLVCHFGDMWGQSFLFYVIPVFLSDVMGYHTTDNIFVASLPYILILGFGYIFCLTADCLTRNEYLNATAQRKIFAIFSHIIPGVLLLSMGYLGCDPAYSNAVMTLCIGFSGAACVVNYANVHDLAPNYAGLLYGIINTFGMTAGIFTPQVIGFFIRHQNGIQEWQHILSLGAIIYIFTGCFYLALGSGKMQSWNFPNVYNDILYHLEQEERDRTLGPDSSESSQIEEPTVNVAERLTTTERPPRT